MSELYWLNVLGNLNGFCRLLIVLSIIAFVVCAVCYFVSKDEDLDFPLTSKSIAKFIRFTLLPILIISTIGNTFIPDTKTLYVIYGIGGTLDYLKENKTAKQIPDKVILAEKNITNKALAEQLGVGQDTISKWVTNSSQPNLEMLIKLSDCLNVSIEELIRKESTQQ